jgi:hypothetical protein
MFLGSRARPARKADNLTAICEPIVYTMWDPRRLTPLYTSTACYRDSFTIYHRVKSLEDRLCGLVVRVLGYRSGGPGSIPGTTKKK